MSRIGPALRSLVAVVGVAGSLIMLQQIASDQLWRRDFTPEQRHVLSDHARQILAALDRDVLITAFLRAEDPRNKDIRDLLLRVSAASPRLRYRVLDVNRNPAVAQRYGVDAYGAVVVESGRRRKDFANPDEQLLMAAIVQVTRPGRRRVYFLTGHGEHSINDRDRRRGYSYALVALIHELYEVEEIRLVDDRDVPEDAAALIIAGAQRDLSSGVVRRIDAYVRRGGGLLVLLDPGDLPNLIGLLQRYGVAVSNEVVLDEQNRLFAGDFLTLLVPGRSTAHPVGAALQSPPLMSQVRAVTTVATEARVAGVDLLKTSAESWRTPNLEVLQSGAGSYVAGRDTPGPVPVAVSVLVRTEGDSPGRLLVYGDSDFATNFFLEYLGNRDLFLNSVNWLAQEDTLVASRPPAQLPGVNQFFLSESEGQRVFWIGTIVQPGVVLLVGLVVFGWRRLAA
jgi:ABC-type uncharacterized transport system involved in gliding motility auxiliary subunit